MPAKGIVLYSTRVRVMQPAEGSMTGVKCVMA
jgi:hypothetical protein